jgi:hypothetical protein
LEILTKFDALPIVHRQQIHCCAVDLSSADNLSSFPNKMICPKVAARIKKRDKMAVIGISSCNIRARVGLLGQEVDVILYGIINPQVGYFGRDIPL